MTCCFWCPNCGWVETALGAVYSCRNRCANGYRYDFGFYPTYAEWRDDRGDLAMALELADLITDDAIGHDWDATYDSLISVWLRAEVIAALRGER